MLYRFYLFVFCWFAVCLCHAQTEEVQIKVYGFEEGLSHRNVFKIRQDPQGYMWLATFNGLNRFDGLQFEVFDYHTASEPTTRFVSDLVCDSLGHLYVLDETGIYRFHPNHATYDTCYQVNPQSDLRPQQLLIDHQQRLWYNTFSSTIGRSLLHTPQALRRPTPLAGNYDHKPMIATPTGVFVAFDDHKIRYISQKSTQNFTLPLQERITHLTTDHHHKVWVLTEGGHIFYKQKDTFVRHPLSDKIQAQHPILNTLLVEPNGDLWLGGFSNLWHYSAETKQLTNYNNRIRQVTKNAVHYRQVFQDRQGLIWVASDFGAIKINRAHRFFQNYLHEGSEYCHNGVCSMRGITGDGERYVYLTYYNSIHRLDTKTDAITPLFRSFPFNNAPFGIFYHDQHLYTGNGLKINTQTLQVDTLFVAQNTDKGVVTIDKDHILWMAFERNLHHFNTQNEPVTIAGIQQLADSLQSDITFLYQGTYKDYFWIATQGDGLFCFDKKNATFRRFHTQNSLLSHNRILALYEDDTHNLWVATANGLHRFHLPSEDISLLSQKDGLTNNFINGILSEGDSCLWVSTDNGLARYSKASGTFTNYYQQDGLSSNEFNRISFYQSPNGRMYFGGLNGVNAFFPSKQFVQEKEQTQAPILWTSFARFDGRVDSLLTYRSHLFADTTLVLGHQDRFFTIEFALADYANPTQNNYSYMLEGFEPAWSKPSNNHTARYYNLPAGEYTFKVRAAAVGENWNEQELHLPIRIKEAFYNTWWFLSLATAMCIALLLAIVRYRIYRIEKSRQTLEKEVQLRTQELHDEKQKSDALLLNILPAKTAEELKRYGKTKAKRFDTVTVFFSDFQGFSKIAAQMQPEALVAEIDQCFRTFDEIMDMYGLEKIKTIGDAYMCAGGFSTDSREAACKVVQAALEIQAYMAALALEKQDAQQPFFEARIGIHTGSVVAGVVGIKKFAYDIWGETVNVAARMEEKGVVGRVNISEATYQLVKDRFDCVPRGKIKIKDNGIVDMYFVEGKR